MIEALITELIGSIKTSTAAYDRNSNLLEKVLAGASVPIPDAVKDAAVGQARLEVVDTPTPAKVKKEKAAPVEVVTPEPAAEETPTPEPVAEEITETDPQKLRLLIQSEVKGKLKLGPEYKAKFDAERVKFGVPTAASLADEQLVEFLAAVKLW